MRVSMSKLHTRAATFSLPFGGSVGGRIPYGLGDTQCGFARRARSLDYLVGDRQHQEGALLRIGHSAMGIAVVAFCNAVMVGTPLVMMTSSFNCTSSAARAGSRSTYP